jgi:hypothetical protein
MFDYWRVVSNHIEPSVSGKNVNRFRCVTRKMHPGCNPVLPSTRQEVSWNHPASVPGLMVAGAQKQHLELTNIDCFSSVGQSKTHKTFIPCTKKEKKSLPSPYQPPPSSNPSCSNRKRSASPPLSGCNSKALRLKAFLISASQGSLHLMGLKECTCYYAI